MHDSYLPAIIRTASPNLHIEPRRRSDRVREPGALSLTPATSRVSPLQGTAHEATPPAPVAQWIEQAPSKRLAAGSSPAGGASLRPPPGEGFSLVRAVVDGYDEAPDALFAIKGRLRGCPAVTGFSGVAVSNTCRSSRPAEDQPAPDASASASGRSPATSSRRFRSGSCPSMHRAYVASSTATLLPAHSAT